MYEFTGALSLAAKSIGGKTPDAVMADYRNSYIPRLQDTKEAIAVETRATILNPDFIKERIKGMPLPRRCSERYSGIYSVGALHVRRL